MTYLVTGATGGLGSLALTELKKLVPTEEIIVLARSQAKAEALVASGIEVRIGDYADLASLEKAFKGVDRLLFVSAGTDNRQVEHRNVVAAAKTAGVNYIAYTSLANAAESKLSLAADHAYTEKLIQETNIPHTFLRNNWYLENELLLIGGALQKGKFTYQAGTGKVGWALRREYAEVAAKALAGADYPEILELSGTPRTYRDLVEALNLATSQEIEADLVTDQDFVEALVAGGLPQPIAELFLSFQHEIELDGLNVTSTDFEKALGRPLTSLAEGIKELLAEA